MEGVGGDWELSRVDGSCIRQPRGVIAGPFPWRVVLDLGAGFHHVDVRAAAQGEDEEEGPDLEGLGLLRAAGDGAVLGQW